MVFLQGCSCVRMFSPGCPRHRAGMCGLRCIPHHVNRGGSLTYDDLFTPKDGGWYETASDDCRAFIEGLADEVVARGEDPTWAEVRRRINAQFPDDATKTIDPIQRAVRNLIADRG